MPLEKDLSCIRLLSVLGTEELSRIAAECRWRKWPRRAGIIHKDAAPGEVHFLTDGCVQVRDTTENGRLVPIGEIEQGGSFGLFAALDGLRRSASIIALQPSVTAALPGAAFVRLLREHPPLCFALAVELIHELRQANNRIIVLSSGRPAKRIIAELLRMIEEPRHHQGIKGQDELAARSGTTRETVTRTISKLVAAGILHREGRTIFVTDRNKLTEAAETV